MDTKVLKYCIILLALICGLNGYAQEDDDIARSINLTEVVVLSDGVGHGDNTDPLSCRLNWVKCLSLCHPLLEVCFMDECLLTVPINKGIFRYE